MKARISGPARSILTSTLIGSLIASLLCSVARADGLGASKLIRIEASTFAPIGKVVSLGRISINGRPAGGEHLLWNGDLLEASDDATLQIDSIGKVSLMRGGAVRLATGFTTSNHKSQRAVLIANLIVGEMTVSLLQESFAYIEASESAFAASTGASFRLTISDGRAVVGRVIGSVSAEPQGGVQSKYIQFTSKDGRSLSPNPTKEVQRNKLESLYTLLQRTKGSSIRRVLFDPSLRPISHQATQDFFPAGAGKLVQFSLDPQNNGTFNTPNATAITDSRGIATIGFTGTVLGPAQVTAKDVETGQTATIAITVVKGPGIFRKRNILIAAAAAGVVVCVFACNPKTTPLRQVPPPIIP